MDLKEWIQSQLTNTRKVEAPWQDLATSIIETIGAHTEQYIDRLKSRNSLYEMNREDLLEEVAELRKIFPLGDVSDSDLAHVIMQRKDEIHFKQILYPLIATLSREFQGLKVDWEALYAPIDLAAYPYGSLLIPESHLKFSPFGEDELFLTSRGVLKIPLLEIARNSKNEIEEIETKIRKVLLPLIPLRIVFDGQLYLIQFEIYDFLEWTKYEDQVKTNLKSFSEKNDQINSNDEIKDTFLLDESKPVDRLQSKARMTANAIDSVILDSDF